MSIDYKENIGTVEITIDRPESKNAINLSLLQEIHQALDVTEKNPKIKTVLIKGNEQFFCTGMDFKDAGNEEAFAAAYGNLLKRFAASSRTIVSLCEGKVIAGGVGFAAASDIVIAHSSAVFSLTEIMWGLLPANVLPYLIRKTGFQPAYFMTLSSQRILAGEAKEIHLVDILSDDPYTEFLKLNERLSKIDPETISKAKSYFRKLWLINEDTEKLAIDTLTSLRKEPLVQKNIKNYVEKGILPWQ